MGKYILVIKLRKLWRFDGNISRKEKEEDKYFRLACTFSSLSRAKEYKKEIEKEFKDRRKKTSFQSSFLVKYKVNIDWWDENFIQCFIFSNVDEVENEQF
jgi:hypothetical protein